MKKILLGLTLLFSTWSFANEATVKSNLEKKYPTLKISQVQPTDMKGLYSARYDNQVIYLNEDAEHIFIGSMIRLKDQKNLTKDLVVSTNSIDFKTLPFQDAIKMVKGDGKRQLVVFSDPNCPYCKTLEESLNALNNITIYTFMFPIKPQSVQPSKQVWCTDQREFAWKNLIEKAIKPEAKSTCENPVERNLILGKKLGLTGTPALIFSNGFKVTGARSAKEIEKIWQELGL